MYVCETSKAHSPNASFFHIELGGLRTEGDSVCTSFRVFNHLRKDSKLVMYVKYSKQSSEAYSTFNWVVGKRHWPCDQQRRTHVHPQMRETRRNEARIRENKWQSWRWPAGGLLCKCQLESHQHSAVHTRCLLRDKHGKYICKVYTLNMGSWQGLHVLWFCLYIWLHKTKWLWWITLS